MALEAPAGNQARRLTNDDFWRLRTISEFRISPDGHHIAYTVNWLEEETDSARSAIWLLDLPTGERRQLTPGRGGSSTALPTSSLSGGSALGGGECQPRWSPDGTMLAFVGSSAAGGAPQIHLRGLEAHDECRAITNVPGGAFSPAWSPDGKAVAFVSAEVSDDHLVPSETDWLARHRPPEAASPSLRRVTRLKYRLEGRGYVDSRTHIFTVDVSGGGEPVRRTDGPYDDGPPDWSPDGKKLVFSSSRGVDPEAFLKTLCILNLETGELRQLNGRPMSEIASPVFSPDGNHISYYGAVDNAERGYLTGLHVWVVSRRGKDEINASGDLDRQSYLSFHEHFGLNPVEPPCWSTDGSRLYFNAADLGDEAVFAVAPNGGAASRITSEHTQAFAPRVTRDGASVICLASTPTHPFEICRAPAGGGALTSLTDENPWLRDCRRLVEPELISFKGPHDIDIEGWLIRPTATDGTAYPLILHVHGGPYLGWASTFYFQFQTLAAAGIASLYINPRGSAGYGQAFARLRDYGQDDYLDLMTGLDTVLELGEVDPNRLGVTGLSYGGFMTNWVIGHTDRFACALSINGLASWLSMQSSSDIGGRWPGFEWGGNYWDSDEMCETFRQRSPITYIRNVKTPLMLFGSECDYRVPIEQEELMLTALRVQGKTVEMVRFPNANHIIATSAAPHHRVLQWQLAQDWFERWLG